MKNWLFKTFGETNAILWLMGLVFTIQLSIVGLVIWVAYHFISKYW